jgi:hypothetical protein
MTANDPDIYQRTIHRVVRLIIVIGVLGSITATIMRGPRFGFGFLLGASLSCVSFWRWKKFVDALGGTPRRLSAWTWLLRLAVLIAAAYAIVKYLEVTPAAVFIGLLVSTAAVIVSMIYELIHGT